VTQTAGHPASLVTRPTLRTTIAPTGAHLYEPDEAKFISW